MKPPIRIETDRLNLRRPRLADAPAVFAGWVQDPQVTRFLTWKPHRNIGETEAMLEKAVAAWDGPSRFPYMLEVAGNLALAGMLDLRLDLPRLNLGYVLSPAYWGQGYMTEAVRAVIGWALAQPGIWRVEATTDTENIGSQRVMQKAGMICEGTLRKYILHPNLGPVPRDSFMYAIVK